MGQKPRGRRAPTRGMGRWWIRALRWWEDDPCNAVKNGIGPSLGDSSGRSRSTNSRTNLDDGGDDWETYERRCLLGLRLLASSSEPEIVIDPHVPGLLRQISNVCGLGVDGHVVRPAPSLVKTDQGMMALVSLLQDQNRRLPVIVVSGDERRSDPSAPLLDAGRLASATLSLAHTVVVPARFSYKISEEFGRIRSCFRGAVRVYMPRFDDSGGSIRSSFIRG